VPSRYSVPLCKLRGDFLVILFGELNLHSTHAGVGVGIRGLRARAESDLRLIVVGGDAQLLLNRCAERGIIGIGVPTRPEGFTLFRSTLERLVRPNVERRRHWNDGNAAV